MKFFFAALALIFCCLGAAWLTAQTAAPEKLPYTEKYHMTVLLLPLDSRPACTQFVVSLGKIAGIRVILPPPELLDHYKRAGDPAALRAWCGGALEQADAAILSVDMLLHGGLIASRYGKASKEDTESMLNFLQRLHQEHPLQPLYTFNILPRLWPSDSAENAPYQKELLAYAKLIDQVYTFENPQDIKKLSLLKEKIPAALIDEYHRVFEENFKLNKKLIALARQGTLCRLVIGQDDSESFGVPNLIKRRLLHEIQQDAAPTVFITKGADEIALTLLAGIRAQDAAFRPKVHIKYAAPETPRLIMPFMATSVATSAKEKLTLLDAQPTDDIDAADFVFFISVGTGSNTSELDDAAKRVGELLRQNKRVALVDLSMHFSPVETILPRLIKNNAPINRLIAYSGWNTTSNAVGMALAQAAVFSAARQNADDETLFAVYQNNVTFLTERFLEDYFYLKESIDTINSGLRQEKTDPYDFKTRARWADTALKAAMINQTLTLRQSAAYQQPFIIPLAAGAIAVKAADLTPEVSFPWERTFEIELRAKINFKKVLTSEYN